MASVASTVPVLLALLFLLLPSAHAATREYTWIVSLASLSPDGYQPPQLHPVINGMVPGPSLEATVNDTIVIRVINELPTSVTSVHWHGVSQIGTPHADGAPGATQCSIAPHQTYVYRFHLDRPGTLWWHSHTAFQKSTLYGSIIIHGDEDVVGEHEERTLVLSEWWHRSSEELIFGLFQRVPNFGWVGDADSLLINGKGVYNCSVYEPPCAERLDVIDVEPDSTYRVRVVGALSLALVNLHIDAHAMEVVEVETHLVKPFMTNALDVSSGQSYSVLLRTKSRAELNKIKHNNGLFWIRTTVRHREGEEGFAILRYSTAQPDAKIPSRAPRRAPGRDDVDWSLRHARRFRSRDPVDLPPATRHLSFLGTQNLQPDGQLVWAVNNITMYVPATPLMHAMQFELRDETRRWVEQSTIPTPFDYNKTLEEAGLSKAAKRATHVVKLQKDEVVDILFQNTRALNGVEEVHPWHLHLHNFWVLAYGDYQTAWTESDRASYNLRNPLGRNTFSLYPGSWVVIRLKADNPGIAFFHCHILAHLDMGMSFMLQVGEASDVPPPPRGTQFCGAMNEVCTSDLPLVR